MKNVEKWKYRLRYLKAHNRNYKENERLLHSFGGRIIFFTKMLFMKVFELEIKKINQTAKIYFFGKKLGIIPFVSLKNIKIKINYSFILLKLRFLIRHRKIRVGFHVNLVEKWTCQSLYDAFSNSKYFEPIIMISRLDWPLLGETQKIHFQNNCSFFDEHGMKYIKLYDEKKHQDLSIKIANADIIFYQQPWYVPDNQSVDAAYNSALLCYTPYCVYSMNSSLNYTIWFHMKLWRFFVETDFHMNEYKKIFNARNCKPLGFVKLDNYQIVNNIDSTKYWKSPNKKRIIYAPHHSFEKDEYHAVSTFMENGAFILDFAKSHPEIEWKFRPHPAFKAKIVGHGYMNEQDVEEYFNEWEKIGSVSSPDANYYEEFITSDGLITDCISFLTEYLPSCHPVFHLRTGGQLTPFNNFTNKIIESYYQIYSISDFLKTFDEVIINGNDYLKEKRVDCIKNLQIDKNKTTGKRIVEYLEKQLLVRR